MDASRGTLGLDDVESGCVAGRLEADTALRDALGANPAESARWDDLGTLARECRRVTSGAADFANGIQAQTGNALPVEKVACVRDHYAALPAEQTSAFVDEALDPTLHKPETDKRLADLLTGCGIDPQSLPPPIPITTSEGPP